MLAHFQEEAVGRTHGVDGDETTIIITPNIIMSVIPSLFFSFLSLLIVMGLIWLGYAAF